MIEIRRERSADLANLISNKDGVKEAISRHGDDIDWTDAISGCVILSNGVDAIQVYEQTADRDWQVITFFADTCRGRRALDTGLAMRKWMEPHADLIFGSIPNRLRHAMWFYRQLGGVLVDEVVSGGYVYVAQPDETLYAFRSVPETSGASGD